LIYHQTGTTGQRRTIHTLFYFLTFSSCHLAPYERVPRGTASRGNSLHRTGEIDDRITQKYFVLSSRDTATHSNMISFAD
ncbi:unnamed protein product, partial [Amoebophrya sp. A25]